MGRVLFAAWFLLFIASLKAVDLDRCPGEIQGPGVYQITQDIPRAVYSGTACFDIESKDVHIDCKGRTITTSKAVWAQATASRPLTNLSITNCIFKSPSPMGWGYQGIWALGVKDSEFKRMTIEGYSAYANRGLLAKDSYHNTFSDLYFRDNKQGIVIEGDGNVLQRSLFENGEYLATVNGNGNRVEGNSFYSSRSEPDGVGLTIIGSQNTLVRNTFERLEVGVSTGEGTAEQLRFEENRYDVGVGGNVALVDPVTEEPLKVRYGRPSYDCEPGSVEIHWSVEVAVTEGGSPLAARVEAYDSAGTLQANRETSTSAPARFRLKEKKLESCLRTTSYTPHKFVVTRGGERKEFTATVDRAGTYSYEWNTGSQVTPQPPGVATPTPPNLPSTPIPPAAPTPSTASTTTPMPTRAPWDVDWNVGWATQEPEQEASGCYDGTPEGECSQEKPFWCSEGELVEDCVKCGCPQGFECIEKWRACQRIGAEAQATPQAAQQQTADEEEIIRQIEKLGGNAEEEKKLLQQHASLKNQGKQAEAEEVRATLYEKARETLASAASFRGGAIGVAAFLAVLILAGAAWFTASTKKRPA